MLTSRTVAFACSWALVLGSLSSLAGYEPGAKVDTPKADAAKPAEATANLPDSEQRLAEQYRELERVLMVMRDLTRQNDPTRAALIEKALKESGDRQVDGDFSKIVEMLKSDKLMTAMEHQSKVDGDLRAILELLQSATQPKPSTEKKRIQEYLNRVNQFLAKQKELRSRNAEGGDMQAMSPEQGDLAEKVGKLSGDIRKNEEKLPDDAKPGEKKTDGDKKPSDPKPGSKESPDKNSGDKNSGDKDSGDKDSPSKSDSKSQPGEKDKDKNKDAGKKSDKNSASKGDKDANKPDGKNGGDPKDGQPSKGEPSKGEPSKGEPSKGEPSQGQPSQGQPSQGQPGQGQPSDGQPQDPQSQQEQQEQNPARQRLDAAQRNMKDAEDKLKKAQREGSKKDMDDAIRNLETAKADLEEILRQMREEEMKRLLAMLESRFRKILVMQRDVNDNTLRLDKVVQAERSHGFDIESGKLGSKETDILVEVDSCLRLLHEEGSAIATPAAVEQIRKDMEQVMQRLARSNTGLITQDIERDIIAGLEHVIDALKQAQKQMDNKKQPPGPSPNGQPQDPPLIEMLSELKMIRYMQDRINVRTQRYSEMIPDKREQAEKDDLLEALQHLGEQQEQVYRVTRDLELGKNQ